MRTFSVDLTRLEDIRRTSEGLHASYRELSQEQRDMRERLQRLTMARDEKLRVQPRQGEAPEDATILALTGQLQALVARQARVAADATHAGRLATAADEYVESMASRNLRRWNGMMGIRL